MLVLLIPLGIVVFAGVVYLAISKKSSLMVRIAALAALALMITATIVCLYVIFGSPGQATAIMPVGPPVDAPPMQDSNFSELLMFIVFLIAIFLLVFILSLREQRLAAKKQNQEKLQT
jgi:cytochrome bd-type quinol oxidase subunit 2